MQVSKTANIRSVIFYSTGGWGWSRQTVEETDRKQALKPKGLRCRWSTGNDIKISHHCPFEYLSPALAASHFEQSSTPSVKGRTTVMFHQIVLERRRNQRWWKWAKNNQSEACSHFWDWCSFGTVVVPNIGVGSLPGTWGELGQLGGGCEGGPGPPGNKEDKQSVLNEGRDNMENDEEERASWAWWRQISTNRVSHFSQDKDCLINIKSVRYWIELTFCSFQENKSYGVKTIGVDPLSTCRCTSRCKQLFFMIDS
jgi:hypothetical protein